MHLITEYENLADQQGWNRNTLLGLAKTFIFRNEELAKQYIAFLKEVADDENKENIGEDCEVLSPGASLALWLDRREKMFIVTEVRIFDAVVVNNYIRESRDEAIALAKEMVSDREGLTESEAADIEDQDSFKSEDGTYYVFVTQPQD